MERFNRLIVVMLAVMLAITTAGCGGTTSGAAQSLAGDAATSEATTSSPATPSPASTVPAEVLHVSVTFNGTDCVYAGPAVFPRGASVEFAFANTGAVSTNEPDQAALLVAAVKVGTTWQQATQAAETIPASAWPPPMADLAYAYGFLVPPAGTMTMWLVGDAYYVGCGTPPDSTDRYYSAALLQIIDG